MRVKFFDESHEKDLEAAVNAFISGVEVYRYKISSCYSNFCGGTNILLFCYGYL